jgi:hypothetical protein
LRWDADDDEDAAIGTFVAIGGDVALEAIDQLAESCEGVRIGVGTLRGGGVFARVRGESIWNVRGALLALSTTEGRSP